MKGRLFRFILIFAGIVVCADSPGLRAEEAPEQFLQAYQAFQAGEKLEGESDPRRALLRYREAELLLSKIATAAPDWQPLVVEYRLKRTRENIARLEKQTAGLPPLEEDLEGPLPSASEQAPEPNMRLPAITTTPGNPSARRNTEVESIPLPGDSSPALATTLRELAAARKELRTAQAENRKLSDRLEKTAADLKSALFEVDRTKVTVVELKSQIAQAGDTIENLKKDRGADPAAIRAQRAQDTAFFLKKLAEANADTEVLREENETLLAKLERASEIIKANEGIRAGLLEERKGLAEELKKNPDKIAAIQSRLDEAEAAIEASRKDLVEAREKLAAQSAELKKQQEGEKARIEKSAAELAELKTQKTKLEAELAKARASAGDRKEVDRLASENKALANKLADAEKRLLAGGGEAAVVALKSELNSVNDRLLDAQNQISARDARIEELAGELDKTAAELARLRLLPEPTDDERTLLAENELLRGIILRQIKLQNSRDEALRNLESELSRLKVKSETLNVQLAILGSPVLELSSEEKSLFKDPVALLTDPEANKLDVTLAITQPSASEATENVKPKTPQGAAELTPEARAMVQEAQELFNRKDYAGAERLYQKIAVLLPENYFVLSNLGAVQIEAGKPSAAEVALGKAILLSPEDSFAQTHLGIAYSRQGRFDEAQAALSKAITLNPSDAVAHNYLGVCLAQKGDRAASEETLKKAISLDGNYANAHFNLAVLYATDKPPALELAKQHYQLATKLGAAPDAALEQLIQ